MPNPYMRVGTPNRSHEPSDHAERHDADVEAPESAVDVFPYRGTEAHGVDPTGDYHDPTRVHGGMMTRDAHYEPEPPPEHVVPVRVVNESADEWTRVRVRQVPLTVGGDAVQICGRDRGRKNVSFKCPTANAADIPFFAFMKESANAQMGYPIQPQSWTAEKFSTQDSIWLAVPFNNGSAQGTTVYVYVAEEVSVIAP